MNAFPPSPCPEWNVRWSRRTHPDNPLPIARSQYMASKIKNVSGIVIGEIVCFQMTRQLQDLLMAK